MNFIKVVLRLTKVRITVAVALSASFGYIVATDSINEGMILPVLGVFLIACGSSAVNQIQERKADALMPRSKYRPLPAGHISFTGAVITALVISLAGFSILFFASGLTAVLLGALAYFWYNGIYTPLKKISPLAVVPGSVIGAIPPAIGWVAGGGSLEDPRVWIICIFFFIWQIPHFWLLLLIYDEQYKKAGFPVLTKIFSHGQLSRITFSWITALTVLSFMLPLFGIMSSKISLILLIAAGIYLVISSAKILKGSFIPVQYRMTFGKINLFVLLFLIIVSIDRLIN